MYFQSNPMRCAVKAVAHQYSHGDREPEHAHTTVQLLHTISGLLRVDMDNGSWIVPPGRGLWIPAGMKHSLRVSGQAAVRALFIDPLARADLPGECQVFEVSPLLRELIVAAINIPDTFPAGGKEERVIELILDELRELSALEFCVPEPQAGTVLHDLCSRIGSRLEHPWSLTDASRLLGISERSVSRRFHQHLGMSFGEWLRRARLSKGMELLASGCSVLETSLAVGYDSPASFSTMFKSRAGVSPTDYFQE